MNVLLFSGGVDSTALAWGFRPDLLFFVDYGQLAARGELRACRAIAKEIGLQLETVALDLRGLGSGDMAGGGSTVGQPPEHWPFRNQMLLTLGAMRCTSYGAKELMIGSVAGDDEHDDGTHDFRVAASALLGLQGGPVIKAPGALMTAEELIQRYSVPDRVLHWTYSCHRGDWACGVCRGCAKHQRVMDAVEHARRGGNDDAG